VPTSSPDLFEAVESKLKVKLGQPVRTFLCFRGLDVAWTAATSVQERLAIRQDAERLVGDLLASGVLGETDERLTVEDPGGEGTETGEKDQRWGVWADLLAKRSSSRGRYHARSWSPLVVTRRYDLSHLPLPSERIEISVDSRLSLRRLKRALDEAWPRLVRDGWVRSARPIGRRGAELVEHVCLASEIGVTWRDRFDSWNARHPDSTFSDVRAFTSAFRRAEKQLTGRKYGLAWFYDQEMHGSEWVTSRLTPTQRTALTLRWSLEGVPKDRFMLRFAQLGFQEEVDENFRRLRAAEHVEAVGQAAAFDGDDPGDEIDEFLSDEGLHETDLPDISLGEWKVDE